MRATRFYASFEKASDSPTGVTPAESVLPHSFAASQSTHTTGRIVRSRKLLRAAKTTE